MGDYLYERANGEVSKLGVYEESDRILIYPENDAIWDEIESLQTKQEDLRKKIVEKRKELKIKTLKELKNENKAT